MRLFVAVWPPPPVVEVLGRLARPDHPSVRWTPPGQWHVTLRFLGEVDADDVPAVVRALADVAAASAPRQVVMGPTTVRLGRAVLVVPVAGLDDVGSAAIEATRSVGAPPSDRPFTGHLTVARGRGRANVPGSLAGEALTATWVADELALVRSHLGSPGARYETLASLPFASEAAAAGAPGPQPPDPGQHGAGDVTGREGPPGTR